jgi:hypothetical protein
MDAQSFGRRATPPPPPDITPAAADEHRFGRPLTQQEIDDAKRIAEERRKARDDREKRDTQCSSCDSAGPEGSLLDALFRPRDPSVNQQEPGLFERLFGGGDGSDGGSDGGGDGGGGGD